MRRHFVNLWSFVAVALLCTGRGLDGAFAQTGPEALGLYAIVERFCRLDAEGARLTPKGREGLRTLLSGDVTMPEELDVIKNYSVSKPTMIDERRASVRIDSTHLGFLNTRTARFRLEAPGLHLLGGVTLTRSGSRWKIDEAGPEAFVTVAAARRFVTELRAKTKDPTVKKTADRTLAALRRLL